MDKEQFLEEITKKMVGMIDSGMLSLSAVQDIINEYDLIIRVDRAVNLSYPNFVARPVYPELEKAGLTECNVTKLERWQHPKQKSEITEESGMDYVFVDGDEIHEKLKADSLLNCCLGLYELWAILARGTKFFLKHFAGKAIYGWKGAVQGHNGRIHIPYLHEEGGKVILAWSPIDSIFSSHEVVLLHAVGTK